VFLVEAIRIFAALMIIIFGVSLLFAALVAIGVGLGWNAPDSMVVDDVPISLFSNTFPIMGWLAVFLALAIPAIFLGVLGVSLLSKRVVINQPVGWTLFSLWILGLVGVAATVPAVASQFRREGTYEVNQEFRVGDRGLYLDQNQLDDEWNHRVRLQLEGFSGSEPKLEQTFSARGRSREDAQANARMINYTVVQRDTTIIFDSHFEFKKDAKYREQHLRMKLYIPYGKKFRMDPELADILENTLYRNGYDESQMEGNIFHFTESEGLVCLTCTDKKDVDNEDFYSNSTRRDYRNFQRLNIKGPFKVVVEQDDRYRVAMEGDPDAIDDIEFDQSGDELEIRWRREFFKWEDWNWDNDSRVTIRVTMPEVKELNFSGATLFDVRDFENTDDLDLNVSAGARGDIEVDAQSLNIDVDAAGQLTLRGKTKNLEADVTSAAKLSAFDLEAENADVQANSGASMELNVTRQLDANANSGGSIRYRGDARVRGKANSGGSIDKE